MARKGLLKTFRPTNTEAARLEDNTREAFDVVCADHDVLSVPALRLAASAPIPSGQSVVVFAGGASRILMLPGANALGTGISAVVYVINASTVAVTLAPSGGNTINNAASLSLAAGKLAIAVSDGATLWKVATS